MMIVLHNHLNGIIAASRQKIVPVTVAIRSLGHMDELGEAFWRKTDTNENRLAGE